jgi:hypothetical protein
MSDVTTDIIHATVAQMEQRSCSGALKLIHHLYEVKHLLAGEIMFVNNLLSASHVSR